MEQLILHLVGDYLTQSDWMAQSKRKSTPAALAHALAYAIPFLFLAYGHGPLCWMTILWTHFLIDRFGLARYVVWAKNWLAPRARCETFAEAVAREREWGMVPAAATKADLDAVVVRMKDLPYWVGWQMPWSQCAATGYRPDRPEWLSVCLLIVADNTIHLAINYAALRWL